MRELILGLIFILGLAGSNQPQFSLPIANPISQPTRQIGGDILDDSLQSLPLAKEKESGPQKVDDKSLGIEVSAQSGVVIDKQSGQILWEKNAYQPRSIASITKLMAALVFLENNPGWDKEVTIAASDQREGGVAFFAPGEVVSVRDLFYVSLVKSINCTVAALVRSTGLSEEEFVIQMNQKAQDLGLNSTHFVDPTGLASRNISTALEVAFLLKVALDHPAIANATTLKDFTAVVINKNEKRQAGATNYLLTSYLNSGNYKVLGGKTGFIEEAGYCLTSAVADKAGHQVISVVLGSATAESRFTESKGIIDWTFNNYQW
ncbi:MAG: serine hydrolase [Patescibacteria group bacterium]